MELLLFFGVLMVVVGIPMAWLYLSSLRNSGPSNMVHLDSAAGEVEAETWQAALRSAGINCSIRNVGHFGWYGHAPYPYELWAKEKDEQRTRRVLGL